MPIVDSDTWFLTPLSVALPRCGDENVEEIFSSSQSIPQMFPGDIIDPGWFSGWFVPVCLFFDCWSCETQHVKAIFA